MHDEAKMKAAIAAVLGKIMSNRQAAKMYNIPHTTLHRHTGGKYKFVGPPTELTAKEEKEIAEWATGVSKRGFPITTNELKDCVQLYLNKSGRETKFKDNRPGYIWTKAFFKRHPSLAVKLTENIDKVLAGATENMICDWYSKVSQILFLILLAAATQHVCWFHR